MLVDKGPHAADLETGLLGADRVESPAIPRMVGHLVPFGHNSINQVRLLMQPKADREECRANTYSLQHVEERRTAARVRTVVEGQGHGTVARIPPIQLDDAGA